MLRRSRHGLVTVILLLLAALPIQGWAGDDDEVPLDQIVVTATRTQGLIRDEPLRVLLAIAALEQAFQTID
jgi:hypothetical protein